MVLLAAGLSLSARANRQFIAGGIRRGLSGNEIGRQLQAAGRGISRQSLQQAVRHFTGVQDTGRYIRALGENRVTDPARLQKSRGFMRRNFAYVVDFQAVKADGSRKRSSIRITSDTVLTRQETMDEFEMVMEDVFQDKENYDIEDFLNASISGGFRRV